MPGSAGLSPQSGGGSVGTGVGPSLGSKRAKALRVSKVRQHKHPARPHLTPVPALISDSTLVGGTHSSGRD